MLASTPSPADIFAQLEALVLPVLEQYQSDLLVQDRNTLAAYTGPFLLSYRATGTNLLVLGSLKESLDAGSTRPLRDQVQLTYTCKRAEVSWDYQKHFLYFDGREFRAVSRSEALRLTDDYYQGLLAEVSQAKR